MLLTWGQFAWVFLFTHQRLNVEHSNNLTNCATTSSANNTNNVNNANNFTKQTLNQNKELFYQWLVGFTDGDGTFCISNQNGKWSLIFQLSQNEYNARLLHFIKKQLGVGNINIESKTKMVNYRIRNRKFIAKIIFPIFDKYLLLTSKYFNYLKFKKAYEILEDKSLTKTQKDESLSNLIKQTLPEGYISPAWEKVDNLVSNTYEAKTVMSKA